MLSCPLCFSGIGWESLAPRKSVVRNLVRIAAIGPPKLADEPSAELGRKDCRTVAADGGRLRLALHVAFQFRLEPSHAPIFFVGCVFVVLSLALRFLVVS